MRTLVLRVVAEPPQVFWAPLMPAAGNVLINITAMLFGIMLFNVKPASTFSIIADNVPESDCEQIIKTFGAGGGLNGGPIYGYAVTATNTGGGTVSTVIPDTDANARSNCAAPGSDTVAIQFVING